MTNWIERVPARPSSGHLLVVDGGATHSRVAVAAPDGTLAGYATGGPTNARSVGDALAIEHLVAVVSSALADAAGAGVAAEDVTYGLVTSASIDTVAQSEAMSDPVRALVPNAVVATVPDTMGCWASSNALGPAAAVIAGTGSVVVAADRATSLWRRFGGWDYLLGDEGSGYGLGRAALRETLLHDEGRSDAAALSAAVLASEPARARGVTGPDDLPDAVHKPFVDKAWIASFAPVVLELAAGGDDGALRVVRAETGQLADAAAAAIDALPGGLDRVTVGLFGGTFASAVLAGEFAAAVAARTERPVDPVVPDHSALVGAFTIALGWGLDPAAGDAAAIAAAGDLLMRDVDARRPS